MTNAPAFRQIAAPLDVPDAELDHLNNRMGVPTLVKSVPMPEVTTQLPPKKPATPVKAVNVHLPGYVVDALKNKARKHDCSVRYLIMLALAARTGGSRSVVPDDPDHDFQLNPITRSD